MKFLENKRVAVSLIAILLLALMLRGVFFVKYLHYFNIQWDAKNYQLMSHQLVDKGIFGYWYEGSKYGPKPGESNARVTPGYPLFLSAAYAIFHDPYKQLTIVRLTQVIVGGLFTPLLAFLFLRRLFKRNDVGLLTAFFMAIYPTYVQSSVSILTEVLSLATMLLYFYLTLVGLQERKTYINVLAGVAFGVHILIRPAMLPLFVLPFIFVFFEWKKEERKNIVRMFVQSAAGFVVVMMPWWIRNIVVLKQFILTADASGNPLLEGTYPYMKDRMADVPESIRGISKLQAEFAKERIIKGFTTEPLLYLKWYTVGKIQYMFQNSWLNMMTPGTQLIHKVVHGALVSLGAVGVIINSITGKINRYINLYLLLFLGLYLIFLPDPRYAYQHMFFLMLAGAYMLCRLWEYVRKGRGSTR